MFLFLIQYNYNAVNSNRYQYCVKNSGVGLKGTRIKCVLLIIYLYVFVILLTHMEYIFAYVTVTHSLLKYLVPSSKCVCVYLVLSVCVCVHACVRNLKN